MALKRLNYYKKYLNVDITIHLKFNIGYSGLLIGIREKDLVFQANQKILYELGGPQDVIHHKINMLDIIYINPEDVLSFRLGKEPPPSTPFPFRHQQQLPPRMQPRREIVCVAPPQGPSAHSLDQPQLALPAENLDQELPKMNAPLHENSGISVEQTLNETNGIVQQICNGAGQEVEEVIIEKESNILEIERDIYENYLSTMRDRFETDSDTESYNSSSQSDIEPRYFPPTSNRSSLNTTKINRFGKNKFVEKYELYCKSNLS